MTNEKVIVSKEVAGAIEHIVRSNIPVSLTLNVHSSNGLVGIYAPLQKLDIEELSKALLIGYEVEKSPEEKIREYYIRNGDEYASTPYTTHLFEGRRQGIVETLDLLEIKIGGVNA
jgi:hypothetical protein